MTITTRLGLLAAVAILPALAACQPAAPVDTAKEEAAINATIDTFNAAAKAKDADKMVSIDAADVRGYGAGAPDVASKDDDLKGDKGLVADPNFAMTVKADHTELAKSGDQAWQTGTVDITVTDPQTKAAHHEVDHYVAAYRKGADGWKLAAVASAPPAAPEAPAADAKAASAPAKPAAAAPAKK